MANNIGTGQRGGELERASGHSGLVEELMQKRFTAVLGDDDGLFRRVAETLPVALFTTDAEGRITFFNDAAAALWGRRPRLGEDRWCGAWKLYWPDGRPMRHDECPMATTLKTGVPVTGAEAIAERPNGERYPFRPYPTLLFDEAGNLAGAANMLVDMTDQKQVDVMKARLAAIVESSEDAIVSKTLDGTITSWNKAAERMFGYAAEEIVGKSILTIIPDTRHSEEPEILARIGRGERLEHFETVRRHKDGTLIDLSITVSPVRAADGTIAGASKIARDISERKRAEQMRLEQTRRLEKLNRVAQTEIEHRKKAERAKELLLNEIRHRVKNTLATVQAIARQTFRVAAADEREAFLARLRALAEAHDLLTNQSWESVSLAAIVGRSLSPFDEVRRDRIAKEGAAVSIDPNKALLLAMILHELGTNSIKYGALSGDAGQIKLSWTVTTKDSRRTLALRWRESGGPRVELPSRQGFGSRMIEQAISGEQGRARIDFPPDGLACEIELPL